LTTNDPSEKRTLKVGWWKKGATKWATTKRRKIGEEIKKTTLKRPAGGVIKKKRNLPEGGPATSETTDKKRKGREGKKEKGSRGNACSLRRKKKRSRASPGRRGQTLY